MALAFLMGQQGGIVLTTRFIDVEYQIYRDQQSAFVILLTLQAKLPIYKNNPGLQLADIGSSL